MFRFLGLLVTFLIAISVIRRVLRILQAFWAGFGETKARPSVSEDAPPGHVVLVQDPVCGMYVAADTSLKRIVDGKVIHFCSPECRDKFQS